MITVLRRLDCQRAVVNDVLNAKLVNDVLNVVNYTFPRSPQRTPILATLHPKLCPERSVDSRLLPEHTEMERRATERQTARRPRRVCLTNWRPRERAS